MYTGTDPSIMNSMLPSLFPVKGANNVRIVMNPLWRGLGNIHGFVLGGKSYRQG